MQAEMFKYYGFNARVSYDGRLGLVEAEKDWPWAALIDIGLPEIDGYEVARRFRELEKQAKQKIKLIAITGYGQDEDIRRSREAGFDHHFVKPVDFDCLLDALKEL